MFIFVFHDFSRKLNLILTKPPKRENLNFSNPVYSRLFSLHHFPKMFRGRKRRIPATFLPVPYDSDQEFLYPRPLLPRPLLPHGQPHYPAFDVRIEPEPDVSMTDDDDSLRDEESPSVQSESGVDEENEREEAEISDGHGSQHYESGRDEEHVPVPVQGEAR